MSRARRIGVAAVVVALLAGGWVGRSSLIDVGSAAADTVGEWSTKLRVLAAAEPDAEAAQRTRVDESVSALLTIGAGEGEAAFALLASDSSGEPLLLILPQDLLVAVPGFGENRLVDALVFGGPELVELAITNEFGVRIDAVVAVPAGAVEDGLPGPVDVDLSVPLFVEEDGGSVKRVLPAGVSRVTPDLVETLLVVAGTGDEFEWVQRQGSAWRAILDAVDGNPRVADRITALGGVAAVEAADLLVTIATDPDGVLATIPIVSTRSAAGTDAVVPALGQADDFVRERLAHLLLRPKGRPRLEVLNGNGRIGATFDVSAILIRAGFRVVRTDNADDFEYEQTLVVAQGDHALGWAREVLEILGRGLVFREVRAPSGVVDLSIIVGHDIPSGEG